MLTGEVDPGTAILRCQIRGRLREAERGDRHSADERCACLVHEAPGSVTGVVLMCMASRASHPGRLSAIALFAGNQSNSNFINYIEIAVQCEFNILPAYFIILHFLRPMWCQREVSLNHVEVNVQVDAKRRIRPPKLFPFPVILLREQRQNRRINRPDVGWVTSKTVAARMGDSD